MAEQSSLRSQQKPAVHHNLANLITFTRFPLLAAVVGLLLWDDTLGRTMAVYFTGALILMDTLDGVVARRRHETTLLGSALDIAADRAVEIVLWVVYAYLHLIPLVIPLIVIVRGMLTDSIRSAALEHGLSAHSMMRSRLGAWLVASPPMRTGYAVTKFTAFVLLAATLAHQSGAAFWPGVYQVGLVASWLAVAFCLVRGAPVLIEARDLMRSLSQAQD